MPESFKHAGTGALHRQHVTAGATVTHVLAAAQVLVPDPVAKLALSGVRLLSQLGTSAAVSGGLLAGAATAALLLYVGYQLSSGPGKDGEAIRLRADAYERYLDHRRKTIRVKPAERRAAREDARQKLFAALNDITEDERNKQEAGPPPGVSAQENCSAFYAYRRKGRAHAIWPAGYGATTAATNDFIRHVVRGRIANRTTRYAG